ncbi:hypothetical protein [Desulfovibrio falkowii]|uniref:hypothetical protein n=1 Tax=Desulfovibrio sp. WGS1351 TaxID=3366814 RepID=UPI00372D4568
MKNRILFQLVMLVALSIVAFAMPALAEEAASTAGSFDIVAVLEGLLPESTMTWITFAITICAALAVALPAPKEGGNAVYKAVYTAIQWLALNVGRAKNASSAKSGG